MEPETARTMSISYIPFHVKLRLWGKAAGRCQYEGCSTHLWLDSLAQHEFNAAYIAHIIADSQDGPRGDEVLSERLEADLSELMLLCDRHHRIADVAGHPVSRLVDMKVRHETRIERVSGISENLSNHILLYGANIGAHASPLSWNEASQAIIPYRYPAERPALELGGA